jgi:hypothetical protein
MRRALWIVGWGLTVVGLYLLVTLIPADIPQPYKGKLNCEASDNDNYTYDIEYPDMVCSIDFSQVVESEKDGVNARQHQSKSQIYAVLASVRRWVVRLEEDPIAVFTLILTASTVLLWRETKRTAGIAERSLTDLERPWLFVTISAAIIKDGVPGGHDPAVMFNIFNGGRFPSEIIECFANFVQAVNRPDTGVLRDEFITIIGPNDSIENARVRVTEPFRFVTEYNHLTGTRDISPQSSIDWETFFVIHFRYKGIGSRVYVSNFSWRWDHSIGRWGNAQSYRT